MKRKHVKIPFSLIVKQAGLDRAARWMPCFGAFIFFVLLICAACSVNNYAEFSALFFDNDLGLCFNAVGAVFFVFAVLEFIGAFIDFFLAWLSLWKARN